jgi:CubicO group peptidase (beta-lactamase class C family)
VLPLSTAEKNAGQAASPHRAVGGAHGVCFWPETDRHSSAVSLVRTLGPLCREATKLAAACRIRAPSFVACRGIAVQSPTLKPCAARHASLQSKEREAIKSEGFTQSGIERIHRVLNAHVQNGVLPGLVALVSSGSDVHVETLGRMFTGGAEPMQRDTIFRIASITKPVTAVAAMILIEECKMRLEDPVERWIPELSNRQVLRTVASDVTDTVPARRAITVRDVFTYRFGFGSVMAPPGTYPIQQLIRERRIGGDGPPLPSQMAGTDEWLKNLGSLPLLAQPGERWLYHAGGDLLGALVERVAGQRLGTFMRERIFEPLAMRDTSFSLPPDKRGRLPGLYMADDQTQALHAFDDEKNSEWNAPPPFDSGAGGLLSTIDDYFSFATMMFNRGRAGDRQILSRSSVELMTSDHLSASERRGAELFFGEHASWGLGLSVDIRRDQTYHVPGRFGWDGGFGTSAYIDPTNKVIGLLFSQRMMTSPLPPPLYADFWTSAYAAIV